MEAERDRRTVFACQIHPRVDEKDIFDFFSQCGKVRDVQLIRDAKTSKSKGLAYVEFHDQASVALALAFSGQLLGGYPISVQVTQSEKNRAAAAAAAAATMDSAMRLYVSGLAPDVAKDDLEPIFGAFGDLEFIELKKDIDSSGCRGGYVQFAKGSEAMEALQNLNGLSLLGQNITLSQVDIMGIAASGGGHVDPNASTLNIPGLSTTALDEGHGGMQMSANSRLMLMQRLQASAPVAGQLNLPPMPMMNAMQAMVTQMPKPLTSQFCQLKNMFDPSKESGKTWEKEIRDDVKDECSKFGRVLHCAVDKKSLGHVYLKFEGIHAAQKAVAALNGRWFAQKQIVASYVTREYYDQRYPESKLAR
uniref:RNA-binding protein 39 isoform X1 n=1 Tax=Hirondellea gigas TaxID=1518452 RepID=A0A6A7FZR4_9CRUS